MLAEDQCRNVLWQGSGCPSHGRELAGSFPRPGDTSSLASSHLHAGPWSPAGCRPWCGPSHGDGHLRQGFPRAGAPPWRPGVPKTLRRPGALPRRKKMPHHIYPQGTPRKEIASLPEALSSQGDQGRRGAPQQNCRQGSGRARGVSAIHSPSTPASSPLLLCLRSE